ncbi:metal ABC transporter substrate-binding protein [Schaalia sp. ZJ1691]|uniref:metal ABC transporter substrate-binding protein n=1 Tax=Schaalia sp. ZJ1691 TaxID=2709404 RepID=UPI0013E9BDD8|nr:metal ABC transporter substrate-binding protein [Schaalia sp. ZJ1691]
MTHQLASHRRRLVHHRLWAIVAFLLAGVVALSACSPTQTSGQGTDKAGQGPSSERPVVLTTFTVLADIARNVAGDHLQVESITKPGAEIHEYEPTPGDIRKASSAALILDNGLNLESWFEKFVEDAHAKHVVVSEGVSPLPITEDAYAGKPNPHAWMSPLNVQTYAKNMAKAFAQLDPAHAQDFHKNAEEYAAKLQKVHDTLTTSLDKLPKQQRVLVTCEGAFSYLTRDAGLQEKYIWPVNAEQQATPQQIASAITFVRENKIPAVFCESTVSDAPMQQVVEATGAQFGGTLYVDSLSQSDGPVPTYLDLITHDVDVIRKALTAENTQ